MTPSRKVSVVLLFLDLCAAAALFKFVIFVRGAPTSYYALFGPVAAVVFAVYLVQGYKPQTDMLSVDYASQHTIAILGALVATLFITYAVAPSGFDLVPQSSRSAIVLTFIALIPVTISYRRLIYLRSLTVHEDRSLVFLGDPTSSEAFREECERMRMRQRIIYTKASEDSQPPWDKGTDDRRLFNDVLTEIEARRIPVEAIILRETARELPGDVSRRLVQLYFTGVPTYTLELFHQVYWQKIPVYRLNQTWLFQEGFEIAREPVFERLKRIADVLLSWFGLLLAAPIILLCGIAIWLEDRGPVFFAQTRIGKNHAPFRLLKLRTMRTAPVTASGDQLYTKPGDARITRVGRFLRTSRLDELPQLWNVLVGDMSLIGPRAEWDRLVATYERDIPCYHFRHLVKPGVTGWAQVNYPYGASTDDTIRKLEYDLYYIRHFSFLLDATIVLKTIHIMLFGKGR